MQKIQVGTKGLAVKVQVVNEDGEVVPVDGTPVFHFEGPNGSDVAVNGAIEDASEGRVAYVLTDGDGIAEDAGKWKYQVALDLSNGWVGRTAVARFEAVSNLS